MEGRVGFDVIDELTKAYQRFAKVKNNFEVVFIYQRDTANTFFNTEENTFFDIDENIFRARFKTMPLVGTPV